MYTIINLIFYYLWHLIDMVNFLKKLNSIFSLSTLKNRIVITLTAGIMCCCFLMVIVSYNAIYRIQEDKIKTVMSFDLQQQSAKLAQKYANLLQITQQMAPEGNVGSLVEEYFAAKESYNRLVLSRSIASSIGLITFSNSDVELVTYYYPKSRQTVFANLPLQDDFSLQALPDLEDNANIIYQSPHLSQCRFSADQVASVVRKITFSNGQQWIIYVETKSDTANDINMLSRSANMPYILTLLDRRDRVRYCSNPNAFSNGQILNLDEKSGTLGKYIWNQTESGYEYKTVLLVPAVSYNHEFYIWKNHILLIFGLTVIIMAFITIMLLQLIYKPLRVFESEMESIGQGNMNALHYRTGIDEFDKLFDKFNTMKQQIQQLMHDVQEKEERRHQLELEKLIYQINPHFLLNTLNSVHWLAVLHKQNDIGKVISTLNFLLSYNIGRSKEPATLRTEIKVLRSYIELQQMRYDFKVIENIEDGEYLDRPVARFILQPVVENAIYHGIDENGTIEINVMPVNNRKDIKIVIKDNGKGINEHALAMLRQTDPDDSKTQKHGIGLRYVRSILKSFYGNSAYMTIDSMPGHGTAVTLCLPLR